MLNPWTRSRQIYVQGKRGWRQLLKHVSPDARLLLMSNFFWTVPLALTEPYKSIYFTKLGLDAFRLGGVTGLEMGLMGVGVLAGGWLGTRYGHKRTLIWGDIFSWVLSTLVLAMATRPAHVAVWACLMASNSVVSASFQHIFLHRTPQDARTGAYGFMNLSGVLPAVLLPFGASLLLERVEFVAAMRMLFLAQTLCMAGGIYLRFKRLSPDDMAALDSAPPLADRLAAVVKHVAEAPGSFQILAFWILANIAGNLWRVYFSLYAVQRLAWPEASLGYYSQIGAAAFVLVSLYWLPRLKPAHRDRDLFWINLASLLPPLLLLAGPGLGTVLGLNLSAGAFAALNAALTAALLSSVLPEFELALSFSLGLALMQLLTAACFPAAGAWFREDMSYFAYSAIGLNLAQAALAFSLWKRKAPRPA